MFCRKSKFSAENPKVPQNFSIFRRIRFNFCGTFGFSMEDLDFRSKFQIFRRTFPSSMELSIFRLNFAIFCRTFRSSAELWDFSAELLRIFRIIHPGIFTIIHPPPECVLRFSNPV